jgi:hypothetical protein
MKILLSTFAVMISAFTAGIYITEYKKFPYHEMRFITIKAKNVLFPERNDSEYRASKPNITYPHLRVTYDNRNNQTPSFVLRSDTLELPNAINFFLPLTGKKAYSIDIEEFNVHNLPTAQCILLNGEPCSLYAKITLKPDYHIEGTYLASISKVLNEAALSPVADLVRFKNAPNCSIAVVYPDYTFLAYNSYGGHSLYTAPFPVAGKMHSSFVAYDRPLISHDITKTYIPTHAIARAIVEMDVGCINLETSSSIDNFNNLNRYKLLVLAGHDEYWTDSLRKKFDDFVISGGKLAVFSGNTNYRRLVINENIVSRDMHTAEFNPTENSIGLACRFGCVPVADIKEIDALKRKNVSFTNNRHLRGMKVIASEHPIFQNTGLQKNDFFGLESSLIWHEIDGAPLNPSTDELSRAILPVVSSTYDGETSLNQSYQAENIIPLASSYLSYFGKSPQYAATMAEFRNGDGVVLNGGSVGWFRVLDVDVTAKLIFQNSIRYLLETP